MSHTIFFVEEPNTNNQLPGISLRLKSSFASVILKNHYDDHETMDVRFQIGPDIFHAHRIILSGESPVFRAMLFTSKMRECHANNDPIAISDITAATFKYMLDYCYHVLDDMAPV